jgi:HK97 family phage prohead protease
MLARNDAFARTSITPDGMVEGYASLFSEIDSARDMVMPGAFAQTLRTRGLRRIPMLFQHDPAEPIGVWLDLVEDARGLKARGRLIEDVARAREVLALVRAGAIDGLSIGFRTVRGRIDPRTRVRRLDQIDLWEISIVTFPLLAGARVRAVEKARRLMPAARSRTAPLTRADQAWRTLSASRAGRQALGHAAFSRRAPGRGIAGTCPSATNS